MGEWVPLIAAVVAGLSAFFVAVWNSRGEWVELRHLKAMNDVIAGLPEGTAGTAALVSARDALVRRVAERIDRRVNRVWRWAPEAGPWRVVADVVTSVVTALFLVAVVMLLFLLIPAAGEQSSPEPWQVALGAIFGALVGTLLVLVARGYIQLGPLRVGGVRVGRERRPSAED